MAKKNEEIELNAELLLSLIRKLYDQKRRINQ